MNLFSDYSFWWLLPMLLVVLGISYLFYFKTTQRNKFEKNQLLTLASLRAFSLLMLFVLLLGVVWESTQYRYEKPLIISLFDNSGSMKNYRDSNQVKSLMEAYRIQVKSELGEEYEFLDLAIGDRVRNLSKLALTDEVSDLASGFKYIKESYFNRNIGAIVLLSDGNFNQGVHPMYEAERIEITPVFSLLAGDTTTKKDALIRSLNSNDFAFVGNLVPIQALVDFQFIPKGTYAVDLQENGKNIQTKTVQLNGESFSQKEITFEVEAKTRGFHQYSVMIRPIQHEFTLCNNVQKCMIEVVDSKRNVLFLASAPHPDVAALKAVVELDKEALIKSGSTTTFTLGNSLPDFVVWYENGLRPNAALFQQLTSKQIPILLILGPKVTTSLLKNYGMNITAPNGNQQEDVYAALEPSIQVFDLSKTVSDAMGNYPPLQTKYGTYRLPSSSLMIAKQRIGSITKESPLIAVMQQEKAKIGLILGEGIWRWKLKEFMKTKQTAGFDEFFQKLTQYISIRQNRDPLHIKFPAKINTISDFIINAEYYNESMELITKPLLELTLTKTGSKSIKQVFSVVDNFYQLNAGNLEAGIYDWKVTASNNGKIITKTGKFIVESIRLESLETQASFSTLNQLAVQSDGKVFALSNYKALLKNLKNRSDITTIQYAESSLQNLIDWKWLFLLMFISISAEWFLRRWWGGY